MSDTFYKEVNQQLQGLLSGETNWVTNLSQTSALLNQYLENINWVGFYLKQKNGNLLLGPFHGKPACIHIEWGKGVCGTAAANREIQVVGDVHKFPGHIACDAASESEIVVPIIVNDKVVGVLDIDSPVLSRFDQDDAKGLQSIVETLIAATDWSDFSD